MFSFFASRDTIVPAIRLAAIAAVIGGLSACTSTGNVMTGTSTHVEPADTQLAFANTPQIQPTAFMQENAASRAAAAAERQTKMKAEAAKRKAAEKKRQLAMAKERKDREAKRLAAFDKMTAAMNDQQKMLLQPQRDSIVKAQKEAEKKVASLTPRPTYSGKGGERFHSLIAAHARANGVPLKLAHAVVRVESSYRPNARGAAGEIGLMQIKLSTARMMGYRGSAKALYHPENNIKWGMKYLGKAHRLAGGSTCGTILKYNAGHGAKRMNPISQRYCNRVRRYI